MTVSVKLSYSLQFEIEPRAVSDVLTTWKLASSVIIINIFFSFTFGIISNNYFVFLFINLIYYES